MIAAASRLLLPAFLVVWTLFFIGTVDGRLEGDDHFALAHAAALGAGDRLNVDFFDPGTPLQVVLSYAGQSLGGATPLAEVVIALVLRLIGLTAVYVLTRRIAGNRVVAVGVAALVALLVLHESVYSAEKVALYPIAILACWAFLEGRLSPYALSLVVAVAALLRHDHGAYVGLVVALAVFLRPDGWRTFTKVALGVLVLLGPWLIWIQATEGLVSYVTSRIAFAQDNGLARDRPFGFTAPYWRADHAARWLWHVAGFTTIAGLVTGILRRSAPLVVLSGASLVTAIGLMRKDGQAAEVAAVWIPLFVMLMRDWRWPGRAVLAAIGIVTLVASLSTSNALRELPQIARDGGGLLRRVSSATAFHRTVPPIDAYAPPGETDDERLIVRYVYECLRPSDRVWETSMWFPVSYYPQRRPVWHLHWDHGLKHDEASQRQFLDWMRDQEAPVIVTRGHGDPLEAFRHYPLVRQFVATHYEEATSPRFEAFREQYRVRLLVDRRRVPVGRWDTLDLPCYDD